MNTEQAFFQQFNDDAAFRSAFFLPLIKEKVTPGCFPPSINILRGKVNESAGFILTDEEFKNVRKEYIGEWVFSIIDRNMREAGLILDESK